MADDDHGSWVVQVNDDGWLTLPAAALRRLGVSEGGEVEIELLADGAVAVRPVRTTG